VFIDVTTVNSGVFLAEKSVDFPYTEWSDVYSGEVARELLLEVVGL
jgi:hypothetical protein